MVFEQGNDPVIQWLSCIIIQKLIILLKVNIEVKCVYNLKELKTVMQIQCKLRLKQLQREYLNVTYEARGK